MLPLNCLSLLQIGAFANLTFNKMSVKVVYLDAAIAPKKQSMNLAKTVCKMEHSMNVWAFSNKYYIPSRSCPQKSFKTNVLHPSFTLHSSPNSLFLEDAAKTGFI